MTAEAENMLDNFKEMQEIMQEERTNKYTAEEQLERQLQGGNVDRLREELIAKDKELQNTIYNLQKLKQHVENAQDEGDSRDNKDLNEVSKKINELKENIKELKKNLRGTTNYR